MRFGVIFSLIVSVFVLLCLTHLSPPSPPTSLDKFHLVAVDDMNSEEPILSSFPNKTHSRESSNKNGDFESQQPILANNVVVTETTAPLEQKTALPPPTTTTMTEISSSSSSGPFTTTTSVKYTGTTDDKYISYNLEPSIFSEELVVQNQKQMSSPSSSQQQKRRRTSVWKPTSCGSLWRSSVTSAVQEQEWPIMQKVGYDIITGRRPRFYNETTKEHSVERCASFDSGVFVPNEEEGSTNTQPSSSSSSFFPSFPKGFDRPISYSVGDSSSYSSSSSSSSWKSPLTQENLIGTKFASLIASQMKNNINNHSSEKNPPWIIFVGDSRIRQILMRLIFMIRSEMPSAKHEKHRQGIFEHYFHRNATYVVFGSDDDDNSPTHDRLFLLPEGKNCDQDSFLNHEYDSTSTSKSKILFRVCLWWSTNTLDLLNDDNLIFSSSSSSTSMKNIHSLIYAPTLHECAPPLRIKVPTPGERKKFRYECSISTSRYENITKEFMEKLSERTENNVVLSLKNFVVLNMPKTLSLIYHDQNNLRERNEALERGIDSFFSSTIVPSSTNNEQENKFTVNATDDESSVKKRRRFFVEMFNKNQKNPVLLLPASNKNKLPSFRTFYIDLADWWKNLLKVSIEIMDKEKLYPKQKEGKREEEEEKVYQFHICDLIHSMCLLKNQRPQLAERTSALCKGCSDEVGFVTVEEIFRILLLQ